VPCPKCGGKDRFSLAYPDDGAIHCRKCAEHVGDGLGALMWLNGWKFPEAIAAVERALGMTNGSGVATGSHQRKEVARYAYTDESGAKIFDVVRFEPKDFRQQAADGSWVTKGLRRVPYHLPEILGNTDLRLYVVEGEKDVETLSALGCLATCNPGGSSSWGELDPDAFQAAFKGRDVVCLADADQAGVKLSEDWVRTLSPVVKSLKLVKCLPLCPPERYGTGWDVTDWVGSGGTMEGLLEIVAREQLLPVGEEFGGEVVEPFFTEQWTFRAPPEAKPPKWAIVEIAYQESVLILGGDVGSGKTTAALSLALSVLTGIPFLGKACALRGPVVLIEEEMGDGSLTHSLQALAKGHGLDLDTRCEYPFYRRCMKGVDIDDQQQSTKFFAEIIALKPALVILDSAEAVHRGGNNSTEDVFPLMSFCLKLRGETKGLICLIDHVVKVERRGARDRQKQTRPAHMEISGSHAKVGRADQVIVMYESEDEARQFICAKNRLGKRWPPLWVKIEGEDTEDNTWKKFIICAPPTGAQENKPHVYREVKAAFYLHPMDYFSIRGIADQAGVDRDAAAEAVKDLHEDGFIDHDGRAVTSRKWKLTKVAEVAEVAEPQSASFPQEASKLAAVAVAPLGAASPASQSCVPEATNVGNFPHPQARNVSARQPGDDRPYDF